MSAIEDLIGKEVLRKDGEKVKVETFCGPDKVVGLYFSAHWCPPCRGFTPQLATFYDAMKAKGKNLEIVFVSSDRDEASWKDYFDSMPWLALDFSDRELKEKLGAKHGVRGIPTFILFDGKTGEVIQREARGKVMQDPEGDSFPWRS